MKLVEPEELKSLIKETVNEVMDSRRSKNLTNLDHELHHLWVASQIKRQRRVWEVARESAIRWGTPMAIIALFYGVYELLKLKTGT